MFPRLAGVHVIGVAVAVLLTCCMLVSTWRSQCYVCGGGGGGWQQSGCRHNVATQISRCLDALRYLTRLAPADEVGDDALNIVWQECGDTNAALRQLAQLQWRMRHQRAPLGGADVRRLRTVARRVAALAAEVSSRCDRPVDLTAEYEARSDDDAKHDDVLQRMRSCGLNPQLLSQSAAVDRVKDDRRVPNVVHYIRFGPDMQFDFQQYLSFLSVRKFIKPDYIFVHGDAMPTGQWWNRTRTEVTNMYYVWTDAPRTIFGKQVGFIQHAADFVRLQILIKYGGIYLDHDVLVVKSFDALRHYDVTLGRELPSSLANGVMVARRGAPFLRLWLESYRSYDPRSWARLSARTPHTLASVLPHLVHIEERSLVRPNWQEQRLLYGGHYDWSDNYCIHIYFSRRFDLPAAVDDIRRYNATLGEVMRFIYFGSSELRRR